MLGFLLIYLLHNEYYNKNRTNYKVDKKSHSFQLKEPVLLQSTGPYLHYKANSFLTCSLKAIFKNFPTDVLGISSINITSSGNHHLAN